MTPSLLTSLMYDTYLHVSVYKSMGEKEIKKN